MREEERIMAKLYVNPNVKCGHINPELQGHFSEHLGRCIYEGIFVGENSDIPNENGMRKDVVEALRLCDNRILKLDSAIDATMRLIDQPVNSSLTVAQIEAYLSVFNGDFTLQTCFLRGEHRGLRFRS